MRKSLTAVVVAAVGLSSAACATGPQYGGRAHYDTQYSGGCYAGERGDDCRERLRAEQQNRHRYVWRDDHYEEQDTTGATIAGGIIGFMLGTAVAGSNNDRDYYNSHRNDRDWQNRCQMTYPNFDRGTGTYVGQDGYRHYCTR
jgi:hypothetical protein